MKAIPGAVNGAKTLYLNNSQALGGKLMILFCYIDILLKLLLITYYTHRAMHF